MSHDLIELEHKAAQLSLIERAQLATFLLGTLDEGAEGDVEHAWEIEADRRATELDSRAVAAVSANDAISRLRARLDP